MLCFLDLKGNDYWHLKTNQQVSRSGLWQSSVAILAAPITACPSFLMEGYRLRRKMQKNLLLENYTKSGAVGETQREHLVIL